LQELLLQEPKSFQSDKILRLLLDKYFSNAQIGKESSMAILRSTPSRPLLASAGAQNNIFAVLLLNNCPEHS
jgi:hypothetical protein